MCKPPSPAACIEGLLYRPFAADRSSPARAGVWRPEQILGGPALMSLVRQSGRQRDPAMLTDYRAGHPRAAPQSDGAAELVFSPDLSA